MTKKNYLETLKSALVRSIYHYFPYKKKLSNSRTSDDIDMKLGPVTNLDKGNKTTSKKIDDDVISENYDVIVIFQFTTNLEQWGSQILNA